MNNSGYEEMSHFFNERANIYDEHMKNNIAEYEAFYKNVVNQIKETQEPIYILDLGCGTGLELEGIFTKAPNARVTGIDMSEKMLCELQNKYQQYSDQIRLIKGSYLETEFENSHYDYVISVMTMHHLLHDVKITLYSNIRRALKAGGIYLEGDFVVSAQEEQEYLNEYNKIIGTLKGEDKWLYHIDIPFCVDTQKDLLNKAGFNKVEVTWNKASAAVFTALR